MRKDFLEDCLQRGYSLERIGVIVDRHPSTVGYWLKKHGLSPSHPEHAPKGGLDRDVLEVFVSRGLSIREIAERVGRGEKSVDYWLRRYGLATERARLRAIPSDGRPDRIERLCRAHGRTTFARTGTAGHYRCLRCRAERVAARRRSIKASLVAEAGSACHLCGYGRCLAALQFHHVDPSTKRFAIAFRGMTRSLERARLEAAKCILLCANCHAEVEAGYRTLTLELIGRGGLQSRIRELARSGVAQSAERDPVKVTVEGSSPSPGALG